MGRMRDEPQGVVLEPVPKVGPAYGRNFGEVSATRAACVYTDIEASQVDKLCAMSGLVHSANGGQDGRCGRLAAPG
jgi:hypothetical protein